MHPRQNSGRALCAEPKFRPGARTCLLLVCAISTFLEVSGVLGQPTNGWDGHTFRMFWENDAVAGSDRHYTQGAGLSYLSPDYVRPVWLFQLSEHLPAAGLSTKAHKVGLALTQEIYTPEDLRKSRVVPDDRPYAGWFYATVALERRGPGWFSQPALDRWQLELGLVGPPSLAEQTQKRWHGQDPKGWDNQLHFEPGLVVHYDRASLVRFQQSGSGWMVDLIPSFGAAAGNVDIHAHLQAQARFGYNVRDEFAVRPPELGYGFYLFGSAEGRYVVRNVFLDGNTFESSHHIDKKPLVGEIHAGLTVVLKRVELTVRTTLRSREFEHQATNDTFAAAVVTFRL